MSNPVIFRDSKLATKNRKPCIINACGMYARYDSNA